MEVRLAADTLLRCQSSGLAGLLAPSATLRRHAARQLTSRSSPHYSRRRTFITTAPKYALKPSSTTAAAPPPSESQNESLGDEKPRHTTIDEAAKNLGWLQGGTSRQGRFQETQEPNRLSPERELVMNKGSSAVDILNSMKTFSNPASKPGIDLSRMRNPVAPNRPESATDMMSAITTMLPKAEKIPIRLSPSTGRSIAIQGNVDVAKGFRLMERNCSQNSVKKDSQSQRYHERRGMKKKRLVRQRWRGRFMEGFKATVARVKKLRRQGW